MTFVFEALPAHKGDALLIHFGTRSKPGLVVIDGGPEGTYVPHLKPRLESLRSERRLQSGAALPIDLLIVSHVDDDHIFGVLEMTREMIEAADSHAAAPYRIDNIWHNTFDDILGSKPEELEAAITAQFGMSAASAVTGALQGLRPDISLDAAKVLASIEQGRRLRDDISRLSLTLNDPFGGLVMLRPGAEPTIRLGTGANQLDIRVIGPSRTRLEALQKKHDEYLRQKGLGRDSKEAALAAFVDRSPTNLSSIVMQVTAKGRTLLLTGDARDKYILEGLRECGLLEEEGVYEVDVLKVPHHGSDRNVTDAFFSQVIADHYVFSGNGEHGNPERETLQMLEQARGKALKKCTVWFTYPIETIDANREMHWEREFRMRRKTRRWRADTDSVRAYLDKSENLRWVDDADVLIDLSENND